LLGYPDRINHMLDFFFRFDGPESQKHLGSIHKFTMGKGPYNFFVKSRFHVNLINSDLSGAESPFFQDLCCKQNRGFCQQIADIEILQFGDIPYISLGFQIEILSFGVFKIYINGILKDLEYPTL